MLMRWTTKPGAFDPLRDFRAMQRHFDQVFDQGRPERANRGLAWPFQSAERAGVVTARDTGNGYEIRADVPGLSAKDLEIDATSETLTIRATRSPEAPEGYRALRRERNALEINRTLKFRTKIDPDTVVARLDQGTLSIQLNKQADELKRRIAIQSE